MKNVVVFGGGTGLSHLLSGLKLFPLNVTAIISVADSGSSTGVLKRELSIPAVGDIGKVMLTMANGNQELIDLLRYRFDSEPLKNHPIRNIMLAALIDQKGNLTVYRSGTCSRFGRKRNRKTKYLCANNYNNRITWIRKTCKKTTCSNRAWYDNYRYYEKEL